MCFPQSRTSFVLTPERKRKNVSMRSNPLVSIVMPTYNHGEFLRDAIESVLKQTYGAWELIVVNNYSTDSTEEILRSYSDSRISIINFANNGIIAASRNRGIAAARGEFIAFMDSDDVWKPKKLEIQVAILLRNPGILAVSANAEYLPRQGIRKYFYFAFFDHRYSFRDYLVASRAINSTFIMRRSVVDEVGLLNESPEVRCIEDYEYFLRIVEHQDRSILTLKTCLIYYRIHPTNNFLANTDNGIMLLKQYETAYSGIMPAVYAQRSYIAGLITIREQYRTGKISMIALLSNTHVKFVDRLDIIARTCILTVAVK